LSPVQKLLSEEDQTQGGLLFEVLQFRGNGGVRNTKMA
jgi:hypothetical protein